jgi:metallo-beta-lactamase family protein
MKITVVGAAGGEVTGSAYYIQTNQASVLLDCGMFQGGRKSEALNKPPVGARQKIDAVLLTHGHLDHTGRLPLLAQRGHTMPVYATPATIDMAALIIRDSARIQAGDAKRKNRKRAQTGDAPVEPLYTEQEAEDIIKCCRPVPYNKPVKVATGIVARFVEAGHMLGSTSIELTVTEDGRQKRVVFSGDLGPRSVPMLHKFEPLHQADMVFLESTYGDRDHKPFEETVEEFSRIMQEAVACKGRILIPTFAVGRAQLLTTLLGWMFRKNRLQPFPLFLDSPMAIEATKIYYKHFQETPELFDERLLEYIADKPIREDLKTLRPTVSASESAAISKTTPPYLVMAGAGMCNAGRILHHLKENLMKPETQVLIVGYQGRGSLGRRLVEKEPEVRIHGQVVPVRAQVRTLGGFSAHAGQKDLLAWFDSLAQSKPRVILTHGEDKPRQTLADQISQRHQLKSTMPAQKETIEL